jgi:curved DNA-binding protein CbpA
MRSHNRLYTILNVLPDADPVVIEAAYKALIKRHHPDIHSGGAIVGERIAADLNQAYQTLRDPERRAAYDADQRVQEERRKAELARAFEPPAQRTAPPPPPRPEPARAGQRVAGLIGAIGVLSLGGAIYLLTQTVEVARRPPANIASQDAPISTDLAQRAFRDQPVNRDEVERAIGEFRRVAGESGLSGAAAYSERCFDQQTRTRAVTAYDHCVAFDHIASRTEASADEGQAETRFQPQSLVMRHIRAAELIARDPSLIEARLFEIRRLADNALGRLPTAVAEAAPRAPPSPAVVATVGPPPSRARLNTPARPRPSPQRRPAPEQDFLERQGGIY